MRDMLGTLRNRLILSHILVLLVTVPLAGIALIYTIETRVLLPEISNHLNEQVTLVAELSNDRPGIWSEPEAAQTFVTGLAPRLTTDIALFDRDGMLLAASDPLEEHRMFEAGGMDDETFATISEQGARIDISYTRQPSADIAEVLAPVMSPDGGSIIGFVYMTRQLDSVYIDFIRLRNAIAGTMIGGLLLGTVVAVILAITLERPIIRVIDAANAFATGESVTDLKEVGPRELRTLARSFNTLTNRLRTMEENRRQLLASLIHELSRPLGAMRAAIQTLQRGAAEDLAARNELLSGIDGEVMRLNSLVENLAGLQDRILGTLEMDVEPLHLQVWLPGVLTPWVEEASEHDIALVTDVEPGVPIVKADSTWLAQAVGNLVSNAIKYTPPGGQINIRADHDARSVSIAVQDTGPGIPPDEQEAIFTAFHRGTAADTGPRGMGLGLSITRDLVHAHGGKIDLKSAPGEGSEFTIRLPLDGTPLT